MRFTFVNFGNPITVSHAIRNSLTSSIKYCLAHCVLYVFINQDSPNIPQVKYQIFIVYNLGYVYLVFDSEKSIKALLSSCTQDCSNGGDWYFQLSSRRIRCKEVSPVFISKKLIASLHFDDITDFQNLFYISIG